MDSLALTDTTPGAPADLEPGEYVAIRVSDTGVGTGVNERDAAFAPFATRLGRAAQRIWA